ncbi:MAG: dephospho-CoA kinase [Ignavibacteria bacterium]|nr:dephospho-CoA kinase [Ignavibacteria bacterium]
MIVKFGLPNTDIRTRNLKIGITGGIGTGKSSFCDLLQNKGYPILKADIIARQIMQSNKDVINAIRLNFGESAYINGELNRHYLAEKVFHDESQIALLNNIVHPVVTRESEMLLAAYSKTAPLVFYEAALIYEAGMEYLFDCIILITAKPEIRVKRVMLRDGASESSVLARISRQKSDEEKSKKADIILLNNGSLDELISDTDELLQQLTLINK